jgi:hypothetical protein
MIKNYQYVLSVRNNICRKMRMKEAIPVNEKQKPKSSVALSPYSCLIIFGAIDECPPAAKSIKQYQLAYQKILGDAITIIVPANI